MSESYEMPRRMVLPTQTQKPEVITLPTLEAGSNRFGLTQEPVFKQYYNVSIGNERQPLLIYENDNWQDIVESFVKFHSLTQAEELFIKQEVR